VNALNTLSDTGSKAPLQTTRELAKAKTRRALLKSALQLYSLEGSCGLSMNKIAKGAGIAQPSFYNHFDSLEALQVELSEQLKHNYLSPMCLAWISMLKDYPTLTGEEFHQRCQHCLTMIFDAAFQNIDLFQRLIEDSLRCHLKENLPLSNESNTSHRSVAQGLEGLIGEIKEEWVEIFIQGLSSADRSFEWSEVHLCVDIATAQVHELILGCHQARYSSQQAISMLCKNFDALFGNFSQENYKNLVTY
jgi:TetR/AcrR family transcriptional regulator of autoinduction and epiphytic fitness